MRPDYYVFGAAADLGDLPAVVDSLRHQLGGQFAALQHDVSACAPRRWPRAR